jgi:aspartate carbamoyltransferase
MPRITHVLRTQDFYKELLADLVQFGIFMRDKVWRGRQRPRWLEDKTLILLFYEPSSRTKTSFRRAFEYLGGREVVDDQDPNSFSSAVKGESLDDTIKMLNLYEADPRNCVIVLRHPHPEAAEWAAKVSHIPIINAGCGRMSGQHPTQALTDYFIIVDKLNRLSVINGQANINLSDLHFVMVGDLRNGRTVRSLCYLIGKHSGYGDKNIRITFHSPPPLRMADDIKEYLNRKNVSWRESDDIYESISDGDVFYWTRIQKEALGNLKSRYDEFRRMYRLTPDMVYKMKPNALILHPFPRDSSLNPESGKVEPEISEAVDAYPQAYYFEQMQYGLWIRMALLLMILK